jgi:hypothetical protein
MSACRACWGPRTLTPVNVRRALWFQTLKGLRDKPRL